MNNNIIDFEQAKERAVDYMVRGTAADGMIRCFALTARQTVQTMRLRHNTTPVVTAALGRLMMGALMMGSMFKQPDELITMLVQGDGPLGAMTVTANCEGQVKGFAANHHVLLPLNSVGKLDVGGAVGKGTLTVIRDLPHTEPYTSQVELVSGEIGEDLTNYFVVSDQIPTSVGVGVLVNRDYSVKQAGGFIIQLMPGCFEYIADELAERLSRVKSVTTLLDVGMQPTDILEYLLEDFDYQELERIPVEFYCGCNEERASRATMALGVAEIQDMIAKGETAEVFCHFCGQHHYLTPEQLQSLVDESAGGQVEVVAVAEAEAGTETEAEAEAETEAEVEGKPQGSDSPECDQ